MIEDANLNFDEMAGKLTQSFDFAGCPLTDQQKRIFVTLYSTGISESVIRTAEACEEAFAAVLGDVDVQIRYKNKYKDDNDDSDQPDE